MGVLVYYYKYYQCIDGVGDNDRFQLGVQQILVLYYFNVDWYEQQCYIVDQDIVVGVDLLWWYNLQCQQYEEDQYVDDVVGDSDRQQFGDKNFGVQVGVNQDESLQVLLDNSQ